MIRPEEIAPLLAALRTTIADVLKPDLASDQTRAVADAVLLTLDRIATGVGRGDAIAQPRLDTWRQLRDDLAGLGVPTDAKAERAAGFLAEARNLQGEIDRIQRQLDQPTGLNALVERLGRNNPAARDWFARAVVALCDIHDAGEPIMPTNTSRQEQVADAVDEAQRLRAALNVYLHRRFPQLPPEPVMELRLVPGGYSKQTAILALVANDVLPQRLVLRRDIPHAVTPSKVADEYPYLEQAWEAGVKTPQPLLLETDPAPLNGSFMLMTEVVGATTSGTYFPEDRRREPSRVGPEFGKEVAVTLAHLHSRTRSADTSAIPDYRQRALDSFDAWRKLELKSPLSLGMELCYAWMLSHPLSADRPYCTTHGDFGIHNLLVRDGHLAAVVDWELAAVGDPAKDLAVCRMLLLPDLIGWDDFVREYVAAGGDPKACDATSVAYFCVSLFVEHALNHLVLRKAFLRGERSDIGAALLITHLADRALQYQARALRIALDSEAAKVLN